MVAEIFLWEKQVLKLNGYQIPAHFPIFSTLDQINYNLLLKLFDQNKQYESIMQKLHFLLFYNPKSNSTYQTLIKLQQQLINSKQRQLLQQKSLKNIKFNFIQIMIASSLSKCCVWHKVFKTKCLNTNLQYLISFYSKFLQEYNGVIGYKFDPISLSQKQQKQMNKMKFKKKQQNIYFFDLILKNKLQQIQLNLKKNPSLIYSFYDKNKLNPPMYACELGFFQIVLLFQKYNYNWQTQDQQGQSALFYATKSNRVQIVKYLVQEVKVNIHHLSKMQRNIVYLCSYYNSEMINYFYQLGVDINKQSSLGRTALSKACFYNQMESVKNLLKCNNLDIHKKDIKGRTALHNAAWGKCGGRDGKKVQNFILQDSFQSVQLLLQNKHQIQIEDNKGQTPIMIACSTYAIKSFNILIQNGANLNHRNIYGETCLHIVSKHFHFEILKLIIEKHKMKLDVSDNQGNNPLASSILSTQRQNIQKSQQQICINYLIKKYIQNKIDLQLPEILNKANLHNTKGFHFMFKTFSELKLQNIVIKQIFSGVPVPITQIWQFALPFYFEYELISNYQLYFKFNNFVILKELLNKLTNQQIVYQLINNFKYLKSYNKQNFLRLVIMKVSRQQLINIIIQSNNFNFIQTMIRLFLKKQALEIIKIIEKQQFCNQQLKRLCDIQKKNIQFKEKHKCQIPKYLFTKILIQPKIFKYQPKKLEYNIQNIQQIPYTYNNQLIIVEHQYQLGLFEKQLEKQYLVYGVDLQFFNNQFICIIQISNQNTTFIFDILKLRNKATKILKKLLQDQKYIKIFHGINKDVNLLKNDLHIFSVNCYDTAKAQIIISNVLQINQLKQTPSLKYLSQKYLNKKMDKYHQKSDFRLRPLPQQMIQYCRKDAQYLIPIMFITLKQIRELKKQKQLFQLSNILLIRTTSNYWNHIQLI